MFQSENVVVAHGFLYNWAMLTSSGNKLSGPFLMKILSRQVLLSRSAIKNERPGDYIFHI